VLLLMTFRANRVCASLTPGSGLFRKTPYIAFAFSMSAAMLSCAANAANCNVSSASHNMLYKAVGVSQGIVPTGFVVPSGNSAVVHGIDASKYQEATNFDGVRDCGGSFAYIRLSAGALADNELAYRALWANAKSANLLTGPYHSFTLIDSKEPLKSLRPAEFDKLLAANLALAREQAHLFIARLTEVLGYDPILQQQIGSYGAAYLPAVLALSATPQAKGSIEDHAQFGRIYRAAACEWINEFQSDSHFHGQPVILFTKPFIYRDYQLSAAPCGLDHLKIWISYYGRTGDSAVTEAEPLYKSAIDELCGDAEHGNRCIFEQYTSFGGFAIYNAGGGLDLDRYYGSIESLNGLLQRAIK
jgi:hypothetical protein